MKILDSTRLVKTVVIICLSLAPFYARAGVVVVEDVQIDGQSHPLALKIKGNTARVDTDVKTGLTMAMIQQNLSMKNLDFGGKSEGPTREEVDTGKVTDIIDLGTGDVTALIHGRKMFMKMSAERANAMAQLMKGATGNAAVPAGEPKIVDTGKQEKVGEYNAEIYTAETQNLKFTFWVTRDLTDYAAIRGQLEKMRQVREKLGQGDLPDTSKLDGIPVKTQITSSDGRQTVILTLVSAKEEPVDDADFQVPADYAEMHLPQIPQLQRSP